jgi:hypothetical protein
LELGEYRADHLLRVLRDCDPVHLGAMQIRRVQANLHDDVLNSVQMDVMMDGLQMDDQNLDAKMGGLQMDDQNLDAMMDGCLKIRLMKDDRLLDDRNYLVDLNCCDVLPCSYSLISMKLISYDHTRIL